MPGGPSSRDRRAISRTQFTEERVTRATSAVDVPLLSNHKICHCVRATGSFVRRYRCSSSSRVRWAGMSNVRAIPSVYTRISYKGHYLEPQKRRGTDHSIRVKAANCVQQSGLQARVDEG